MQENPYPQAKLKEQFNMEIENLEGFKKVSLGSPQKIKGSGKIREKSEGSRERAKGALIRDRREGEWETGGSSAKPKNVGIVSNA